MLTENTSSAHLLVRVHLPRHWWQWLILVLAGCLLIIGAALAVFLQTYQGKIYSGININNVDVSGLSKGLALERLEAQAASVPSHQVVVRVDDIEVSSSSAELGLHYQYSTTIDEAFAIGRTGAWWQRLSAIFTHLFQPTNLTAELAYDPDKVSELVSALVKQVDTPYQEPQAVLGISKTPTSLTIRQGSIGRAVETTQLKQLVATATTSLSAEIAAPVASVGAELSEEQLAEFTTRAQAFVGKSATFKGERLTLRLSDQELVGLLSYSHPVADDSLSELLHRWSEQVDRPAQDPELDYDPDTLKVTAFTPPLTGLRLDLDQTRHQLERIIKTVDDQAAQAQLAAEATNSTDTPAPTAPQLLFEEELALVVTQPTKSLASTNTLGINELIGFGESEYAGSIPSRIHNVAHATNQLNYYLIKPGEEFSFNKALGNVSQATGYQPAYIISGGQTVLGDGGGVCQVSTTLFRSVLNAGLPVTKRRAHSYRVSYYELDSQPGFDATVYSGDVDLRFVNDTGHHVLLYGEADDQRRYMKIELYGTSDGRTTEIVDHVTYDYRSAPPPVYIPDPTLPSGQLKQVDWAASGVKANFKNVVKDKDGNVLREENYFSNYIPWSAKYLRGV